MKIGIDARLWGETGVGRYIRNVVTHLQDIDHSNEYVLFARKEDASSIVIHNSSFTVRPVDIRWHTLKEQVSFAGIIHKEHLDLMHFPYFSLPTRYKSPFVITIHDLILHEFSTGKASTLPMPLYALKRLGFKRVFEHGLRHSQKIIVPLETVKTELISRFSLDEKKVIVTKEGFDSTIFQAGKISGEVQKIADKGNYFLYVGNAYPHKNVEFLIEGFLDFKEKHPEYTLVLVGRDDFFYNNLQKVTNERKIIFMGEVSDSELGLLYDKAEAFVSASFMEGFGLPPLEAMAAGCIPILSDIPSFREVCEENALYFDPKNRESLITGLESIHVMKNDELERRKKDVENRAGQFSWRRTAEDTRRVYESCIGIR